MKQTLLLASLFVLSIAAKAQVMGEKMPFVNVGVKIGGNIQQLSGAPVKSAPGIMAGAYVRKDIKRFGVRLEVLGSISRYTTKYPASFYTLYTAGQDTITKGDFQVIYANVPLMVEYKLSRRITLLAGPQFSYALSVYDKNNAYTKIYGEDKFITKTDFSIVAGVELKVKKHIDIGARINKGVLDVNNSTYYLTPKTWTTTGAQISLAYKIL